MKKISAVITALVTGAILTGCTFGASIDTLMAPPKLSLDQEQIYNELGSPETSIRLKYPKSGKYLSAFIIEDIDGDGGDEAIVFYERLNHAADENSLRISVLDKREDGWHSGSDIPAEGSEVEEVIISKLGANSRINIIIGTSTLNRSEKNVAIYNYFNDTLIREPTLTLPYSYIGVNDLDMDGQNEFLRLASSSNGEPALAEAYNLDKNGKYHKMSLQLSDSYSDFDISYGKLPNGKLGMYIDAAAGNGMIQSEVVYMQDRTLQKVSGTPEESTATERSAGCRCFDVDGDGSIEIPFQKTAPGNERAAEGEQLKLTEWMRLDSDMKLRKCYTSYYSLNDGYIFIFPEKWLGRVTLMRDIVNDEIAFCTYSNGSIGRELLKIYCAEDAPSRDDRISSGYMLMHTKGESAYLAYIPSGSHADGDGLSLTAGELALGFRYRD